MKRIANLFLVPWIMVAMVAASTNAYASHKCSVATLRGAFTLYYVGNIADPNTGAVTPIDAVGVVTFDGAGNASGRQRFLLMDRLPPAPLRAPTPSTPTAREWSPAMSSLERTTRTL
jgi:hypothetical protein